MSSDKHRLRMLAAHISRWLERNGMTQSTAAQQIVESYRALGFDQALQVEDIFFMNTGDVFADVNTNRQKIFRWLGFLDSGDKRSPARLFFVEAAIVAAMPADLRVSYLQQVYADAGVCISTDNGDREHDRLDRNRVVESLIKEASEAQMAVLTLGAEPSREQLEQAHLELKEAAGTTLATLDHLEARYPELKSGK